MEELLVRILMSKQVPQRTLLLLWWCLLILGDSFSMYKVTLLNRISFT